MTPCNKVDAMNRLSHSLCGRKDDIALAALLYEAKRRRGKAENGRLDSCLATLELQHPQQNDSYNNKAPAEFPTTRNLFISLT